MAGRDFLASLMSKGDAPQVDAAAYNRMLAENMARYHGNRDTAVMNTNIAGGYGNSTAQRFMHGGGAPADPMTTGAVPVPTPRPEDGGGVPIPTARPEPPPMEPGIGSGIPMPEPGIGSGIPTPQLPGMGGIGSGIPTPTEPIVPIPTHRPGGITVGAPEPGVGSGMPTPTTPIQGAPVPTSRQYGLKKSKKKKKR
jgi:hypothetical protein